METLSKAWENKGALCVGMVFGFIPPLASYEIINQEIQDDPMSHLLMSTIVLACLVYSSMSVYKTAKIAFNNGVKAVAYVALMEGVMAFSHIEWLRVIILGLLIVINAITTGCEIALDDKKRKNVPATA